MLDGHFAQLRGHGAYEDVPGFCKSVTIEKIREHDHIMTPDRYVGAADAEEDDLPFAERFAALKKTLTELSEAKKAVEVMA